MAKQFPRNPWQICYQSRVGPLKWLEPYTEDLLNTLAREGRDNVLVVPISFVSDHIETLYELDQLYLPMAREAGLSHLGRAPALNTRPAFIEALADIVEHTLSTEHPCRLAVRAGQPQPELSPGFWCTTTPSS
jgi:ferrochelatase